MRRNESGDVAYNWRVEGEELKTEFADAEPGNMYSVRHGRSSVFRASATALVLLRIGLHPGVKNGMIYM